MGRVKSEEGRSVCCSKADEEKEGERETQLAVRDLIACDEMGATAEASTAPATATATASPRAATAAAHATPSSSVPLRGGASRRSLLHRREPWPAAPGQITTLHSSPVQPLQLGSGSTQWYGCGCGGRKGLHAWLCAPAGASGARRATRTGCVVVVRLGSLPFSGYEHPGVEDNLSLCPSPKAAISNPATRLVVVEDAV